ncbi:MAG: RNA 2',3'-cyclic phosphodiesterase [Rhodospirillaceae bacterium]|nr:RNA 2',3'-cyclic phosphodiesterase [Rhodospirillaceae bacterium]
MIRLFVGIPLAQDVRQHLHSLSGGLEGAHWISPENMHLTLRFIGEVDEVQAADINDALSSIDSPAFEISLAGVEAFGRAHMVHTIWAAVPGEPALSHLHGKVERALVQSGLAPERRKFTPHITLARVRKSPKGKAAAWLADHGGFKSPPFTVDHFVLFRSHLGHNGAHYESLAEYALAYEPVLEAELS